jgi:HD-GYP domain-containing protein (c-di-GMP phosphodiesterase class II)
MLHDIGKICIPDEILQKEAPLTKEEYAIIREHPITAYNILRQVPYFRPALDIPYYHHEKWDGTGYPLGLKGKKIPLVARISAVVDVWDALLSDRPYRPAWKPEDAKMYLLEQAGSHFDPQVVRVFVGVDEAPLPFNPERKLYNGQIPENILWHEGGNLSTAMDGRITN